MSSVMFESAENPAAAAFQWNWRHAQQQFAGILGSARRGAVPAPAAAQQALSALSADERTAFEHWLGLHLASRDAFGIAGCLRALGRVDALLAASVRKQLPRIAAELLRARALAVAA